MDQPKLTDQPPRIERDYFGLTPPLSKERMADPFHTPAERVLLARFFKKLARLEEKKLIDDLPEAPF